MRVFFSFICFNSCSTHFEGDYEDGGEWESEEKQNKLVREETDLLLLVCLPFEGVSFVYGVK